MIDITLQTVHTQHLSTTEIAEGWSVAAKGDTNQILGGVSIPQEDTYCCSDSTATFLTVD